MNLHRQAILSGDPSKVAELLCNDSLTVRSHSNKTNIVSERTDLTCCMCGKSVSVLDEWIKKASPFDLSKLACGEECREGLRECRREGHWS